MARTFRPAVVSLVGLLVSLPALPAPAADGFGDVVGMFVLDGDVPPAAPPLVPAGAGGAVCAAAVPDEKVVVDRETKGVANVFIWLPKIDPQDVAPALRNAPQKAAVLDQKNCAFAPHALVARAGQNLQMLNADPVAHNVRTTPFRGKSINDIIAPNDRKGIARQLTKPETLPMAVKCDIHPWMQGWVLVVDHPYATVSDAKGAFRIEGLPAGRHELRVWQEKRGWVERQFEVEVAGGETTDLGKVGVKLE